MAQQALGPGTVLPRERALFGLLDADGWAWASVKAFAWLVIIILLLGYLPDRAYYLTVGRTVDLGVLVWSPINLCPPTNESLPCPAPARGADPVGDIARRAGPARSHGPTARSSRSGPRSCTSAAATGRPPSRRSTSRRPSGPATSTSGPRDRLSPSRAPTRASRTWPAASTCSAAGTPAAPRRPRSSCSARTPRPAHWASGRTADDLALPEARSETASAITPDGLLLIGGRNADGPVATTLKTRLNDQGALGAWSEEQPLLAPQAGATAVLIGDYLWLYGGSDANGPVGQGPARRVRPRGRRGAAREPRHGQAHPLGRQRPGEPAGAPHQRIRLGRQRRDLPRRRQRRLRPQDRALLGGADHRRRPAGVEAPAGQRPARAALRVRPP